MTRELHQLIFTHAPDLLRFKLVKYIVDCPQNINQVILVITMKLLECLLHAHFFKTLYTKPKASLGKSLLSK